MYINRGSNFGRIYIYDNMYVDFIDDSNLFIVFACRNYNHKNALL